MMMSSYESTNSILYHNQTNCSIIRISVVRQLFTMYSAASELQSNEIKISENRWIHKFKKVSKISVQIVAFYAVLKLENKLLKSINLPHKNAQMILLAFITSYKFQKRFQFIKWRIILMAMTRLCAKIFTDTCRNKYKMTTSNVFTLVIVYWCYLMTAKIKHTPKSFANFGENCYGNAYEIIQSINNYFNEIKDNNFSSCKKHLHPNISCVEYIKNGAFRWPKVFKCNTLGTSLRQSVSVFIGYFTAFYLMPCCLSNLFQNRISPKKYVLCLVVMYSPIAKLMSLIPTKSKLSAFVPFIIYTVIEMKMNEYGYLCRTEQTQNKPFFERKRFANYFFAIYVSLSMMVAMWCMKNKTKMNIDNKIFAYLLC
eukprot:237512_1